MSGADSIPSAVPPAVPPAVAGCDPARLLRVSRGFSCLFWSLPLFSTAHAMALVAVPIAFATRTASNTASTAA